jgi:hypothetical protein
VRSEHRSAEPFAVALALFSLGAAAAAAAGRSAVEGAVLVPVRYTVLMTPLHVALLLLALPHLRGARERTARLAAVALGVLLVTQQVVAGEAARRATRTMRDTIQRFAAGETHPDMETVVFDDLPEARRQLDAIRAAGLYSTVR